MYREGGYELLVNKAQWGNLNQEDVVPDRESVREVQYAQIAYSRLAQAMVNHGEFDSAVVVMDKYQEFFPNDKIPFEIRLYQFPEMYYACGATEKGDQFLKTIAGNFYEKALYYCNMKPKFKAYFREDIEEMLSFLNLFKEVADHYQRTELYEQINANLNECKSLYYK